MSFQFPVEAGRILSFARSVGDIRPAYRSQLDEGPGFTLTVPPTFVQSGGHFDPAAALLVREAEGERSASGGRADTLHAEQEFEYFEPLRVGDRLLAVGHDGRRWTKDGRSGKLQFVESITDYRTQAGALAVRARKVSVRQHWAAGQGKQEPGAGRRALAGIVGRAPAVGDTFEELLVEGLSRSHIAQYAGASGDFNLVHIDEDFAVSRAGYPSVIAHGMFTMGLTATFVASLIGSGVLRKLGGRFLGPVLPGDSLRCVATVTASDGGGSAGDGSGRPVRVSFETRRVGDGAVILSGTATATSAASIASTGAAPSTPKGN